MPATTAALESIADAVVTTDSEERITFVNPAAETILGVSGADVLGRKVHDVVRLVDERRAALVLSKHMTALPREARLAIPSGTVEIEGSVAPIAGLGSVMVFRDVTERRQLERRLGSAERLAAIGTMAASMQHEINNPLATVVANIQFALDVLRAKPDGPSREELAELMSALQDASEGAERVRCTVEELRHFSRGPVPDDAPIEITAAIDEAIRITFNAVRHHATIRRSFGPTPRIRAEEGQLTRVFMNLLLNAAQASGDGAAAHTIVLTTRTDEAGRAVAEVSDDGDGISSEELERIFHPFVAMGLGLAVCHTIITSLGGEIDVTSELGKGTTFRISLPAAVISPAPRPTAPPKVLPPKSDAHDATRARILVVDDEVAVGKAIRRLLKAHDVALEPDPRAALTRLQTERYDVVFCDRMMPDMSGMDFFEALNATAPDVAKRVVFLTKPFSRDDLSEIIRRVMLGA